MIQEGKIDFNNFSDDDLFYEILNRANKDKLNYYLDEVKEEIELRKFKDIRVKKLKEQLKIEHSNILNKLKQVTYNDEDDEDDEDNNIKCKKNSRGRQKYK